MFIKRNPHCTLLVHGERVLVNYPPGRPPAGKNRPRTKVVHRTLANLSKLPLELLALIELHCKGERFVPAKGAEPCVGPAYGALAAGLTLAKEAGIVRVLGDTRRAKLALFLVLARLVHKGSRLSATRWAEDQAVAAVLGLERFDEDDLYETLDWIEENHERIEVELAKPRLASSEASSIFLYDVTSSYFEGQLNELAEPGYNRDGKKFKKQCVVGLLTDAQGEPIAIRAFRGNTADPQTISEPIRTLVEKLEVEHVIFVGDRGMVKARGRELLGQHGYHFLTALIDPQVRVLIAKGKIQMELFDETPSEVIADGRRFILRRNPDSAARDAQRRASQLARVTTKVDERNARVRDSQRANPEVSLKQANERLGKYRLNRFVVAKLEGREVRLEVDDAKLADISMLDGCYVLETDVPSEVLDTNAAHDRYKDLQKVERDFKLLKTGELEIRPIYLRKANRTRAHALVAMLALRVLRLLESRVGPLGITARDALDRLQGIRVVTLTDPSLGLWQLPARFTPTQQEVLDCLPPLPPPLLASRPGGPRGVGRTR
ncbi:MAG: IS1634 family transposase [Myxococcota bacterium]